MLDHTARHRSGQQLQEAADIFQVERPGRRRRKLIGPSLSVSSSKPLAKNRSLESPVSASTRQLVAKRGALKAKTKPSGVSSYHLADIFGCVPGMRWCGSIVKM